MSQFDITWIDHNREPQVPPDPMFPNGRDIDGSHGAEKTCVIDLPCPAKRCGHYLVKCIKCGYVVAITTAGRPDDPRSVKVGCRA